jgi:ABC-2 type transport system permease protein
MLTVMNREIGAYFRSPVGYVFLTVYFLFSGFFFFANCLYYRTTDLSSVFGSLINVQLFLIPMLTMRLMSEERKNKTDQALLTAPISLTSMVMGKIFAAAFVLFAAESMMVLYALVVSLYAAPYWPAFWGCFAANLLLGIAFISICTFISSLTENQIIAAVGGYGAVLCLLLIDSLRVIFSNPLIDAMIMSISFINRYASFTLGIFRYDHILFFISVSVVFIFLTVRVFEKRRWG